MSSGLRVAAAGVPRSKQERGVQSIDRRAYTDYAASTTNIEIDSELLARLRERHPDKDDRSLIEDLARIELGFAAVRDAQNRNALGEDQATELAVRAAHEARRASA